MALPDGIDAGRFMTLLRLAREEDLGVQGDISTALLPEAVRQAIGQWELRVRSPGRLCGLALIEPMLAELAGDARVISMQANGDGAALEPGAVVARLTGRVAQMLAAERTILNFLQRLSGVATLTAEYVRMVTGTHAKIYDTRKTLPGWRDLDKYAVRCGGGHNHRHGLFDAVLIKDNHLAGIPTERLAHAVFEMLNRMSAFEQRPKFVEVEVDSLVQLEQLLKVIGIDVILLDNFDPGAVSAAVRMRDDAGLRGRLELEASGGVTLDRLKDFADAGVERIAVGAITHSAVALDIALDAV